ncbi:GAD-like domain-containing protein [Pseudomonas monteilii]
MDEAISLFIEEMGNPTSHKSVPSTAIEHYRTKLPGRLLNYWEDYGWSAHAGGIFWIVNPAEYEGVVRSWLEGTAFEARDIYHVIARTAFGCLYLWGEKTGYSLDIHASLSRYSAHELGTTEDSLNRQSQVLFMHPSIESSDFLGLFSRARKKLGPLKSDEMYGFVPALMLGGSEALENLEKVNIIEHLTFLSQLSPLEPFTLSDLY